MKKKSCALLEKFTDSPRRGAERQFKFHVYVLFLSSRRRHTRSLCDWSSDVCSSDLGIVAIRDREVSDVDVQHVVDAAKAVAIPADQKILHVLPQEFIIDGQEGIRDPIGMSGGRLEDKVHSVTGADSAAQNIEK